MWWRLYYPGHNEIRDPTPEFPDGARRQTKGIITRGVAYLRTTDDTELLRVKKLSEAAVEIFGLLSQRRLQERHDDVESLREVLRGDAEAAIKAAHWIYKQARDGSRMLYDDWHDGIQRGLREAAERVETDWWTQQAEGILAPPTTPAPVPTRAPRTETARCIEAFLHQVEEKTGKKIDKTDFWLRPTKKDRSPRYSSDREFRSFQREDPRLSHGVTTAFKAVLKMAPKTFVEGLEERRLWLKAKRKTKIRR